MSLQCQSFFYNAPWNIKEDLFAAAYNTVSKKIIITIVTMKFSAVHQFSFSIRHVSRSLLPVTFLDTETDPVILLTPDSVNCIILLYRFHKY